MTSPNFQQKPKRGRPSNADRARRATLAASVDPATVDPKAVLAGIMIDATVPAAARVSAAKALLAIKSAAPDPGRDDRQGIPDDPLSRRALEIISNTKRLN